MNDMQEHQEPFVMTLLDTTGIQPYIFRSNILKHIMGASGLVHLATHDWVDQVLRDDKIGSSNVMQDGSLEKGKKIEDGQLAAELVYRGGGNALILFRDKDTAKLFTIKLTDRILREAPGLDVVVVHEDIPRETFFNGSAVDMKQHLQNLFQKSNQKKKDRQFNNEMPGLGVTAACPYTQKPVTDHLGDEFVSAEIFQKEKIGYHFAKDFFDEEYEEARGNYEFVLQFNQFSAEGKGSYMAVVHADGTGMGKRILVLLESDQYTTAREKLEALRSFSDSIKSAVREAMSTLIRILAVKADNKIVPLAAGNLPFRPIVVDGDDITFVCDGKIGLTATALLLKEIAKQELSDGRGAISCRAGIAILKSHFPFSRAYQLAEELNSSARSLALDSPAEGELPPMAINWHISTSGEISSLDQLRERYRFKNEQDGPFTLHMRPLLVSSTASERNWENFEILVDSFCNKKEWTGVHSKLRGLRDVIQNGSDAVKTYCKEQVLPSLPQLNMNDAEVMIIHPGEPYGYAIHYDALEAEDFYAFSTFGEEDEHANQ